MARALLGRVAGRSLGRQFTARVLVCRVGLHPPRRCRPRTRHRHRAWLDCLCGRVQPGVCHLQARANRNGPSRPHAVRMVGHQQRHDRGDDRPVGPVSQHHQPSHRDRGSRHTHAGHPAPAAPTRLRIGLTVTEADAPRTWQKSCRCATWACSAHRRHSSRGDRAAGCRHQLHRGRPAD
jgi:hypothetical protein